MSSRPPSAVALILLAALVLAGATAGMLAGIEPFATWYYQLAWYPTLLAADAFVRLRTGRFFLLGRPRVAAALFAWSVPFWLFFELLNFRMANWYYVFVPAADLSRWSGITLAFATVLPAILLAERVAAAAGLGARAGRGPHRPFGSATARPWLPGLLQAVGVAMVGLALAWPRWFYPLIWGAVTLLLDPVVYRRDPDRSLLADLERGRPYRIVRLLVGGLAIGLVWETFNWEARGKWIYTVPGLEELKLFEIPLAGVLGFPVLALDGWAAWQALVVSGLAPAGSPGPDRGEARRRRLPTPWLVAAALAAAAFSGAVLRGMERFTISSYGPVLDELPGAPAAPLRAAGYDVFELAESSPDGVASRAAGVSAIEARRAVQAARLAVLRGIGTANVRHLAAIGVCSVEALASADPDRLAGRLRGRSPDARHPARIRVWVQGARLRSVPADTHPLPCQTDDSS